MTDTKISGLPAAASANDAMELPVNDSGTTKKVTRAQLVSSAAIAAALNGTGTPVTLINAALATPAEVVATAVGTTGTSRKYKIVPMGAGNAAASPTMTNPVSSAATLDVSNYVSMTPPVVAGVAEYLFYRMQSGGTSPSSTVGFIGRGAPGVEFRDIGINATADVGTNLPSSVDGGSAGVRTTGPIVGTHDQTGNFGAFAFGLQPAPITIGDTQGGTSAMGQFTGNGTSGIYFNGLNAGAMRLIGRSTNSTDILRPVSISGGTLDLSSEQYIKGSEEAWRVNSNLEIGGGSVSGTGLSDNYGKFQFSVAVAGTLASTAAGMNVLAGAWANDALRNGPGVVLTNLVDFVQHRTGYLHPTSTQDPANAEYVFGGWAVGGTTYNFGPKAVGTGTLQSMKLTGASVAFDGPAVTKGYTVATLPSTAATGKVQGAKAFVTDATGPTYLGTLTGGGAVVCPVFYNGSAWVSA